MMKNKNRIASGERKTHFKHYFEQSKNKLPSLKRYFQLNIEVWANTGPDRQELAQHWARTGPDLNVIGL